MPVLQGWDRDRIPRGSQLGAPDTLCRKINYKSTARDLLSRKEILRIVPSPVMEPSVSKPDDAF